MCDTLAMKADGAVWFAKNSDREPDEPQRVERHPAVSGDGARTVRCTYVEIGQVPERRAVIVSRPSWMWGAEMGVNEAGVAIGNEAVFSRSVIREGEALLGMDLVRLGLERSGSADEAARVIIDLLERHGQGGPAGYRNKSFRYDNSFLIADARTILVLETAGRNWALKRADEGWAISNTYTLTRDFDEAGARPRGGNFKTANERFLMPRLARGAARIALNRRAMDGAQRGKASLPVLADMLRAHARGDGFEGGSNADVCMHARGPLRPSATTASMIVRLTPGKPPAAAFTGTPSPCVSLFLPAGFEGEWSVFSPALWEEGENRRARAAKDPAFRARLRGSILDAESEILAAVEAGDAAGAERLAQTWLDGRAALAA